MKVTIFTLLSLVCLPLLNAQNPRPHSKPSNVNINLLSGYWYQIGSVTDGDNLKNVCIKFGKKDKEHVQRDVIGYTDKGRKVKVKNNLTYMGDGTFNDDEDGNMFVILSVDTKYQCMLMGSPDMQYLWVLSRTKTISDKVYKKLLSTATALNYDVSDMQLTSQR